MRSVRTADRLGRVAEIPAELQQRGLELGVDRQPFSRSDDVANVIGVAQVTRASPRSGARTGGAARLAYGSRSMACSPTRYTSSEPA